MSTFLFTFGLFLLMAAAMAVGVIAGRKPIQGSCGGLSAATREDCPICGGNPARCDVTPVDGGLAEEATRGR